MESPFDLPQFQNLTAKSDAYELPRHTDVRAFMEDIGKVFVIKSNQNFPSASRAKAKARVLAEKQFNLLLQEDLRDALITKDIKQFQISALTIQAFTDMQIDPMTQQVVVTQDASVSPNVSPLKMVNEPMKKKSTNLFS